MEYDRFMYMLLQYYTLISPGKIWWKMDLSWPQVTVGNDSWLVCWTTIIELASLNIYKDCFARLFTANANYVTPVSTNLRMPRRINSTIFFPGRRPTKYSSAIEVLNFPSPARCSPWLLAHATGGAASNPCMTCVTPGASLQVYLFKVVSLLASGLASKVDKLWASLGMWKSLKILNEKNRLSKYEYC
jgi:hypothetical protein